MTAYFHISVEAQFALCVAELVIITGAAYILVKVFIMGMPALYKAAAIILGAVNMMAFQGMIDVIINILNDKNVVFLTGTAEYVPWGVVAAFMAVSALSCGILISNMKTREKSMLTPDSIKEFIDDMQDGICFCDDNGMPLLVNRQMNAISSMVTGEKMLSAKRFMDCLASRERAGNVRVIRTSPTVIIETEDGTVWDIRRSSFKVRRHHVDEIMACDITCQYNMNRELRDRLEKLNRVNERLRKYGNQLEKVARESEILAAKIRVHDNIGKCLLAFRAYADQPEGQRDRKRLLTMWKYNMAVMRNEAEPRTATDPWEQLMKAAAALNVEIVMTGDMPEKRGGKDILISAAHECMTNAVKHAGGSRLYIDTRQSDGWMTLEIANDGRPPKHRIEETGGLKNLRHAVERAGGTMNTETMPQFLLRIEIPNGGSTQ